MKSTRFYLALVCIGVLSTPIWAADGPNPTEARLREELRNFVLQLRSTQNDLASAQAAQSAAADENKKLKDELAVTHKQLTSQKKASDKTTTDLKAQLAVVTKSLTEYRQALEQSRAEAKKTSSELKTSEEELAALKQEKIELERKVADRESKNLQMFVLANEILGRYEDYGLGRALAAKEPFVGRTRVKLENMVQDYEDQLSDQRVTEQSK